MESRVHWLVPAAFLFMGIISVILFKIFGFLDNASLHVSAGRTTRILMVLPSVFFFISIIGFTFKNRLTATKDGITLDLSIFWIFKSKTVYSCSDCEALLIKKHGRKGFTFIIIKDGSDIKTLISGKKGKIESIVKDIAKMAGIKWKYEKVSQ